MGLQRLPSSALPPGPSPPDSESPALLGYGSAPLPISDSTPTVYLMPWLSRCPDSTWLREAGALSFVCSFTTGEASAGVAGLVSVLPSPGGVDLGQPCAAARKRLNFPNEVAAQQVSVPVVVALSLAFGTASGATNLTCDLQASGSTGVVDSVVLRLAARGTHWPIAADVIAVSAPSGTDFTMNSSLAGPPSDPAAPRVAMRALNCTGRLPTQPDTAFGACALRAVMAVWGHTTVPAAATRPFKLSLLSTSLLVLRARSNGSFSNASTVTIGGVPAVVAAASTDGRWLALWTPNASSMCGE